MKPIRLLLFVCTALLLMTSCQKELNFDENAVSSGVLKADITGNCLPSTVNGIYWEDSSFNSTHYIDVQVNATSIGTYKVMTDTVNGYSFKGEGTLGVAGLNTIRLYPSGRPVNEGIDTFTVNYGTSTCRVKVTVIGGATGNAVYTLGGAPGACSGASVTGTYQVGVPLTISNFVQLTVDVTVPGIYNLVIAGVNGMTFIGSGVFVNTGVQSVTLQASGTPVNPGPINIDVSNTATTCSLTLNVLPAGSGSTAVFTLATTGSACTGAVIDGVYEEGTAVTGLNTVTVSVNVTTVGTYNISTNVANGISFSKSGTFTATGVQLVVLTASGTPTTFGNTSFTVNAGTSTCTFSLSIIEAGTDKLYIPMTSNSNWTYTLQGGMPQDTFHVDVLPNSIGFGGNTYRIFKDIDTPDSSYFRRASAKYYSYFDIDLGLGFAINADALILDTAVAVNGTWTANLGTYSMGGIPVMLKFDAQVLAKGASTTIGSTTYNNIIKVKYTYMANVAGTGYNSIGEEESWFSRGYGKVHFITFQNDVYDATRIEIH